MCANYAARKHTANGNRPFDFKHLVNTQHLLTVAKFKASRSSTDLNDLVCSSILSDQTAATQFVKIVVFLLIQCSIFNIFRKHS
jgi:hypothetical protein